MRIGNLLIIMVSKRQEQFNDTAEAVRTYLAQPAGRQLIARVARAEAKDFIQENYEAKGQPYHPEGKAE